MSKKKAHLELRPKVPGTPASVRHLIASLEDAEGFLTDYLGEDNDGLDILIECVHSGVNGGPTPLKRLLHAAECAIMQASKEKPDPDILKEAINYLKEAVKEFDLS